MPHLDIYHSVCLELCMGQAYIVVFFIIFASLPIIVESLPIIVESSIHHRVSFVEFSLFFWLQEINTKAAIRVKKNIFMIKVY
jgi:hypothetical protein